MAKKKKINQSWVKIEDFWVHVHVTLEGNSVLLATHSLVDLQSAVSCPVEQNLIGP